MTYSEAQAAGYRVTDIKLHRGYISRKSIIGDLPVQTVPAGHRRGDLYVDLPNWCSTRYCVRLYLDLEND